MKQFQQAFDLIEQLSASDQQALVEIVRRRLIARRRVEIAQHATETIQSFGQGGAHSGMVDDLLDESCDAWFGML